MQVMNRILNTQVTMPLGEVLAVSKELSSQISDVLKLKPQSIQSVVGSLFTGKRGMLIKLRMVINGKVVTVIIDSGSMVNVVHERICKNIIQQPVDITETITMKDANGGEGLLKGLVSNVTLTCGAVKTIADFYVGEDVAFDCLLGRPWQRDNKVDISERDDGTYLVFKDPETLEPTFEVLAAPDGRRHDWPHDPLTWIAGVPFVAAYWIKHQGNRNRGTTDLSKPMFENSSQGKKTKRVRIWLDDTDEFTDKEVTDDENETTEALTKRVGAHSDLRKRRDGWYELAHGPTRNSQGHVESGRRAESDQNVQVPQAVPTDQQVETRFYSINGCDPQGDRTMPGSWSGHEKRPETRPAPPLSYYLRWSAAIVLFVLGYLIWLLIGRSKRLEWSDDQNESLANPYKDSPVRVNFISAEHSNSSTFNSAHPQSFQFVTSSPLMPRDNSARMHCGRDRPQQVATYTRGGRRGRGGGRNHSRSNHNDYNQNLRRQLSNMHQELDEAQNSVRELTAQRNEYQSKFLVYLAKEHLQARFAPQAQADNAADAPELKNDVALVTGKPAASSHEVEDDAPLIDLASELPSSSVAPQPHCMEDAIVISDSEDEDNSPRYSPTLSQFDPLFDDPTSDLDVEIASTRPSSPLGTSPTDSSNACAQGDVPTLLYPEDDTPGSPACGINQGDKHTPLVQLFDTHDGRLSEAILFSGATGEPVYFDAKDNLVDVMHNRTIEDVFYHEIQTADRAHLAIQDTKDRNEGLRIIIEAGFVTVSSIERILVLVNRLAEQEAERHFVGLLETAVFGTDDERKGIVYHITTNPPLKDRFEQLYVRATRFVQCKENRLILPCTIGDQALDRFVDLMDEPDFKWLISVCLPKQPNTTLRYTWDKIVERCYIAQAKATARQDSG
jgi:hypothetical protein